MKYYIDCEFNGFGGRLISMAITSQDLTELFYEVLESNTYSGPGIPVDPWVQRHIIPVLNKSPIGVAQFQKALSDFLHNAKRTHGKVHIVADWPEDLTHLTKMLICGPGTMISAPNLTLELNRNAPPTASISKIPHNALEDAISLAQHLSPK